MWRLEVDDGHSCLDNNGWDVDLLQIVGNWKQNLLKILDSCSKVLVLIQTAQQREMHWSILSGS